MIAVNALKLTKSLLCLPNFLCNSYLGLQSPLNKELLRSGLELQLETVKKSINQVYFDYWTELSAHCGVFYGKSFKCKNYSDIKQAIREIRNKDEVKSFVVLFYISFDFIPNWRELVGEAVLKQHGLQIDRGTDRVVRKKKTFIERMSSQQINNMQKNLCKLGQGTSGFSFTNMRWGDHIKAGKDKEFRLPKHFYPWRALGKLVSL
jgi:hypothetical protein